MVRIGFYISASVFKPKVIRGNFVIEVVRLPVFSFGNGRRGAEPNF